MALKEIAFVEQIYMISKKVISYWALSSLTLIFGIHFLDGWPAVDDWFAVMLSVFFAILLLVVLSIILSVVIASFPFNDNRTPGKEKIRLFIPVSSIVITVTSIIAFVFTRPSYATEVPEEGRLCAIVKEGKFQLNNYTIDRKADTQIETNTNTGEETVYKVRWLTDCECELTNIDDQTDVSKVKIISVTKDAYECVLWFGGRTTRHEIRIVSNGN